MPTSTRAYRGARLVAQGFGVDEVAERAREPGTLVWVDVPTHTHAEDLHRLGKELGVSELAIEDAVSRHERPKVDNYHGYAFVNAYATRLDRETGALTTAELSAIVLPSVLVTVREEGCLDAAALVERWEEQPALLEHGSGALLYGLLDLVVDGHFETVQALDEEIDAIEELLFDERTQQRVQERTYRLRKSLVHLRRVVLPMREVVNTLLRRDLGIVEPAAQPYYQDVYDHVLRVTEWTESLRDMVTTIFETNLSLQDHRLNVVIKKLTSWAAIIAVPTAITGFFGQNVRFPGEGRWSGFVLSLALIIGTAYALYLAFRRRDWI
jgi:magnesium transporter